MGIIDDTKTVSSDFDTVFVYRARMEDDNYTRITLRIPKTLHAALNESAHATSKSMNAEIVARLHQTFAAGTSMSAPVIVQNFDDLMAEFMRRYNITMEAPVPLRAPPEFADQDDDMPMEPPRLRKKKV